MSVSRGCVWTPVKTSWMKIKIKQRVFQRRWALLPSGSDVCVGCVVNSLRLNNDSRLIVFAQRAVSLFNKRLLYNRSERRNIWTRSRWTEHKVFSVSDTFWRQDHTATHDTVLLSVSKSFFGINLKIWCHVSHQQEEELTACLWSGSVTPTLKEKFTQKWKSTKSTVGKFCSPQNFSGASHSAEQLKLETKHHMSPYSSPAGITKSQNNIFSHQFGISRLP